MIKHLNLICSLATIIIISNCSNPVKSKNKIDYNRIDIIIYTEHVQPLLNAYMDVLDKNRLYPPGLVYDFWANLIKGWNNGEVLIPFDSENSLLIELNALLKSSQQLDSSEAEFLKRWIDEGARNDQGDVPYEDSASLLYVCSQAEAIINIIDAQAMVVVRNIKLTDFGIPVSAKPHHLAFSPDGKYFYVSCIDNQVNKILRFDRQTNTLLNEVTTDIPALMDHHPVDDVLYVSRFMLNNLTSSIFALNTETMQPVSNGSNGEISLPPGLFIPHAMGIAKNGNYIYTCSFSEDQFVVINHDTKEFEEALPLNQDCTPLQCSVSPGDDKVYVSCIGTGEIVVVDVSDPQNRFLENSVDIGGQPWHSTFDKGGTRFFVGNFALNNIAIINTSDYSVNTIGSGDGSDGLSQPHGIAIAPDDQRLFVSCRNINGNYTPYYDLGNNRNIGTVVAIDTEAMIIEKVLEIENFGSGMRLWSE